MMSALLGLVRAASSVTIRMIAIRHLKIIFASSTVASAINRYVLIFGSISSMGGTSGGVGLQWLRVVEAWRPSFACCIRDLESVVLTRLVESLGNLSTTRYICEHFGMDVHQMQRRTGRQLCRETVFAADEAGRTFT
ncbi:hypothetical protein L917_03762 [Phytophthora nicotianae]|nr:hypothetical protein L917_03762 [Phytophthora nicotianae]